MPDYDGQDAPADKALEPNASHVRYITTLEQLDDYTASGMSKPPGSIVVMQLTDEARADVRARNAAVLAQEVAKRGLPPETTALELKAIIDLEFLQLGVAEAALMRLQVNRTRSRRLLTLLSSFWRFQRRRS